MSSRKRSSRLSTSSSKKKSRSGSKTRKNRRSSNSRRSRQSRGSTQLVPVKPETRVVKAKTKVAQQKEPEWKFLIRVVDGYTLPYVSSLKGFYPRVGAAADASGRWYPGIYTTYLSSKLNADLIGNEWNHTAIFGEHIFVFHPKVLQDLPFSVCNQDMGGDCRSPEVSDAEKQDLLLLESKGNLRSPPNTAVIDQWINSFLDPMNPDPRSWAAAPQRQRNFVRWNRLNQFLNKIFKPEEEWQKSTLQWSHEVIFDHIPLKYVCHIFTYNISAINPIRSYFPKIPVSYIRRPLQHEQYYFRDYIVPRLTQIYANCVSN